jgi:hypothetical protein
MRRIKFFGDMSRGERRLTDILEWTALLSLGMVIALRIYAVFIPQPVVTYDDRHYSGIAVYCEPRETMGEAVKDVLLPNNKNIGNRTAGYNSCLVLGLKVFSAMEPKRALQAVNLVLFLIQIAAVLFISYWAYPKHWFAVSFCYLYVSMPIIFGLNRWIMTDNLVITALWVFPAAAIWAVCRDNERDGRGYLGQIWTEGVVPLAAGGMMAVFAGLREYAVPSYFLISGIIVLSFAVKRKWTAFFVFIAVSIPYWRASFEGASGIIARTVSKSGISSAGSDIHVHLYSLPYWKWIYDMITGSYGLAMSVLIALGMYFMAKGAWEKSVKGIMTGKDIPAKIKGIFFDGKSLLLIGQLFLAVSYFTLASLSSFREFRTTIPCGVSMLAALLIGINVFQVIDGGGVPALRAKKAILALMAISWAAAVYQLFIAFDGGKSFAIKPYRVPTYNHPLNLRELKGPGDAHIDEKV